VSILRKIIYSLTGGRPMDFEGFTFESDGSAVRFYRDKFGRRWMSDGGRWAIVRVLASPQDGIPTSLKRRKR
jgi:hypothetical protein